MAAPNFVEILDKMRSIHQKKNEDYSSSNDAFSNFTQAAIIAEWFSDPVAKVFATMIGIKLSRIANLMNKGGTPNNESIEDSFLDNETYALLFHCWFLNQVSTCAPIVEAIDRNERLNQSRKVNILNEQGYSFNLISSSWMKTGKREFRLDSAGYIVDSMTDIEQYFGLPITKDY